MLSLHPHQNGAFNRRAAQFRDAIGAADGIFGAERGRYHLFVSWACPWAHRTLIVRRLKGLETCLDFTPVDWFLDDNGWKFTPAEERRRCGVEPFYGGEVTWLRQLYAKANPDYEGRWTVPVLWDRQHETIVCNESSEIIRMLNGEFNSFAATEQQARLDLYPSHLRAAIDEVNAWVYDSINNGVYMCGFATTQAAYDEAVDSLFAALDRADALLAGSRYLCGATITEADVRLWTTLIRFDAVYHGHFKCNLRRIADYQHLAGFMRELYALPEFAETTDFEHIKRHYYESHLHINPTGIVPKGPDFASSLALPHGRDHLPSEGFFYRPL